MRFYLYHLIDPRDGKVFYVGKGQKARLHHHEWEAARGVYSRKCAKIREIQASGHKIGKSVVRRFDLEQDAYDAEKAEIEAIGLANLTNVMPGGVYAIVPLERGPAKFTRKALERLAPGIARCLRLYLDFGRVYACGRDITQVVIDIARKTIEDCGRETFNEVMAKHGYRPQAA